MSHSHKFPLVVGGIIFILMALAHLYRIVYGISIVVNETPVPMSISWIAVVVSTLLGIWFFKSCSSCHKCDKSY